MKLKSLAVALLVLVSALAPTAANAATPATATATRAVATHEPVSAATNPAAVTPMSTGQYEYICQMPNGQSWSLYVGEKTTDCKGSYLQKYINGSMVGNYKLAYGGGTLYSATKPFPWGCAFAIGSAYALVVYPPTGAVAWVVMGSLAAGGLVTSCTV